VVEEARGRMADPVARAVPAVLVVLEVLEVLAVEVLA
jgi:hypothetical protein